MKFAGFLLALTILCFGDELALAEAKKKPKTKGHAKPVATKVVRKKEKKPKHGPAFAFACVAGVLATGAVVGAAKFTNPPPGRTGPDARDDVADEGDADFASKGMEA